MSGNMTALISCFVRAYHYENEKCRVYSNQYARKVFSDEEYNQIEEELTRGITFFNPDFKGEKKEALKWIINNQLGPTVLGRSAFAENSLKNAIKLGCKQYLIYAAGYDTSAYKYKNLKTFEIDKKEMIIDKQERLKNINSNTEYIACDFTKENWIDSINNSSYNKDEISFNSLLGITYYLTKEEFKTMMKSISEIIKDGSTVIFDYPINVECQEGIMNEMLAYKANEKMKSKYTYQEIETILGNNNLLVYEHLTSEDITNNYFALYNMFNPDNKMKVPKNGNYCLAVKQSKNIN